MEKKNIGTDGSILSHIKNLSARGYVRVDEHKRIIPTKLGIPLIDVLNKVVPEIIKPENRAKIEEFVSQIETGEKKFYEAINTDVFKITIKVLPILFNIDIISKIPNFKNNKKLLLFYIFFLFLNSYNNIIN